MDAGFGYHTGQHRSGACSGTANRHSSDQRGCSRSQRWVGCENLHSASQWLWAEVLCTSVQHSRQNRITTSAGV